MQKKLTHPKSSLLLRATIAYLIFSVLQPNLLARAAGNNEGHEGLAVTGIHNEQANAYRNLASVEKFDVSAVTLPATHQNVSGLFAGKTAAEIEKIKTGR